MSITDNTLAEMQAAHVNSLKLAQCIDDYSYGNPAPAVRLGQFSAEVIDAQAALAASAVVNIAPAATVIGVKITGTATAAVAATSQLVATATKKDLSTAVVTTSATWSSSDPTKATVGAATGLVTGVAAGTAVIYAVKDGVKSAGVTFTVT